MTVSGGDAPKCTVVVGGPSRAELLIAHVGDQVVDVVVLPVDDDGLPL